MEATRTLQLMAILVCCYIFSGSGALHALSRSRAANTPANRVLSAVHEKLASLQTLRYSYRLEMDYPSEKYRHTLSGTAFLDFSAPDPILGFRYQMDNDGMKLVYNGTESFVLDERQKTMQLRIKPTISHFTEITAFHNSMVTLRKALPAIISDRSIEKSLADTSSHNRQFYLIRLVLDRRVIERLGGFSELSTNRKVIYEIAVDKSTYLPVQIIQRNNVNKDLMRSVFHDILPDAGKPSELSWYYSSYTDVYRLSHKKETQPLKVRTAAPDWRLPLHGSREVVQLHQLKGKVVLLEFWTKNCGYCITVVPKLNSLVKRYQHEEVTVLGVNAHDTEEDIGSFYQKNKPLYKTVFKGKGVSEAYGIGYFPAIVLLDKKGVVLYQGEYKQAVIESLIAEALK